MSLESRFLRDVLHDPDDDLVRLVYADWLDEHGDPRGEFIRTQIQLARMDEDDPRRPGLLHAEFWLDYEHHAEWRAPFRPYRVERMNFHRGFAEEMTLGIAAFLRHAPALYSLTPLRRVRLRGREDEIEPLARSPLLARLTGLDLSFSGLMPIDLTALSSSPHLAGLRRFDLAGNRLPVHTLTAFLGTLSFDNLTTLDLGGNIVADVGARAIAGSSRLRNLTALSLWNGGSLYGEAVHAGGMHALAASANLRRIEHLDLNNQQIGDAGFARLVEGGLLRTLKSLELRGNTIGVLADAGMAALADAPQATALRFLDLSDNPLGVEGAAALASWPGLREVRRLRLQDCNLGDSGIVALARSPHAIGLRELDLGRNRIGERGTRALLASTTLPNALRLDVRENRIDPPLRDALAERYRVDFD